MHNCKDSKRCFFGLEVEAAWMAPMPDGRILEEENRHITLVFLGNVSLSDLQKKLALFPQPSFRLAPVGTCDKLLFLPEKNPHVVAAHVTWCMPEVLSKYHEQLSDWLQEQGFKVEKKEFLSHVTLARAPFDAESWKMAFSPFPILVKALHLYESLERLQYSSLWSLPLPSPIEEFEHTADIAFRIRGDSLPQLFLYAQMALALKFPPLMDYFSDGSRLDHLDELIIQLNKDVAHADAEIGCPFKAISFHGEIVKEENGLLHWEMIVDV